MTAKTTKIITGIVVLIPILLIAAVTLPSLLKSRIAGNETSALGSIRSIYGAEIKFRSQAKIGRYGSLEELGAAGLIDARLASGVKGGYRFEINTSGDSFEAYATPLEYGRWGLNATGSRSIFINEEGLFTGTDKKGDRAGPEDALIE